MILASLAYPGRTGFAVGGFAALVLATGLSALAPVAPATPKHAAATPRLPMRTLLAEPARPVQLAQLSEAPTIRLQALYAEIPQADVRPGLLLETPDEPAAVPLADTASLIRTALAKKQRTTDAQSQCLAETIYFEARGESLEGQLAVAQVVLNRVKDKRFAKSICGVVQERSPGPSKACQFSFVCDTGNDMPAPSRAWDVAQAVAVVAMAEGTPDISKGALFFHTVHVSPKWRSRMQYTGTVGTHLFYR